MTAFENTVSQGINHPNHGVPHREKTCRQWFILCFWAFFLIVMPLSSVILIGCALFGSSPTAFDGHGLAADILLIITYSVVLIGIFIIIKSIDTSDSTSQSNSTDRKKHSNIVVAFLFVLGVGDSLFILTRFGDQLILVINQNYAPDSQCWFNVPVSMAANIVKSFCQSSILMFILYQLKHSGKFKCTWSDTFQTCLAIFCFIQWIQILLQEVHHHKNKSDSCMLLKHDSVKQFNKITPYLYPLGLEYRFASGIALLILSECFQEKGKYLLQLYQWLKDKISFQIGNHQIPMQPINGCLKKLVSIYPIHRMLNKLSKLKTNTFLSLILFPAVGVLLITLAIVIVLFQEFNTDDGDHQVTSTSNDKSSLLTLISEIGEVSLAIIITIHSIVSLLELYKEESSEPKSPKKPPNTEFKIDFFFLIISNIFLDIYSSLAAFGSSKWESENILHQTIRRWTLAASLIPIFQTALQLIVIWKVRQYPGKLTEGINILWIILSFAVWLFDTFSAKGYNTNQIQIAIYREKWDVFAALFLPMAIFYRFHSCSIFANIKSEAYWHH